METWRSIQNLYILTFQSSFLPFPHFGIFFSHLFICLIQFFSFTILKYFRLNLMFNNHSSIQPSIQPTIQPVRHSFIHPTSSSSSFLLPGSQHNIIISIISTIILSKTAFNLRSSLTNCIVYLCAVPRHYICFIFIQSHYVLYLNVCIPIPTDCIGVGNKLDDMFHLV